MAAALEPLYDKRCKCMMCEKSFSTKKVRSRFVKVTGFDTDFAPSYADEKTNPNYYYVNVCQHCGFSFTDEFSSYFPPGSKQAIAEKICSQWVQQDLGRVRTNHDAIKAYKLAAYCSVLKKDRHIITAGLYIRLAWFYRLNGIEDQEFRFLKLALGEYTESYSKGDYSGTQVSEIRLIYLIGELSRRIGKSQEAVRSFSKVIEKQRQALEPRIIQMAKDRWHEMREEQKVL
jgi:uncharacterized protein